MADQLILEARDEGAGTDGQRVILALAAFELNAVYGTNEIDGCDIILLDLTLNLNDTCILLELCSELLVYFLCAYSGLSLLYRNALILTEGNLRLYSNGCCVDHILIHIDLLYADLRSGNDLEAGLLRSLRIGLIKNLIERILEEYLRSVHLHDHLLRCLALTETRKIELVTVLLVCYIDGL